MNNKTNIKAINMGIEQDLLKGTFSGKGETISKSFKEKNS